MHEFVFAAVGQEAAEAVNRVGAYAAADPDVAVDYPDDVTFGFAVAAGHVADFGVGAELMLGGEVGVLFFDEDFSVEVWEVVK